MILSPSSSGPEMYIGFPSRPKVSSHSPSQAPDQRVLLGPPFGGGNRSDERCDRARRHLQRPGDLLRRAPGVPQFTNTVKQLLRWHRDIVPRTGRAPWPIHRGAVSSHAAKHLAVRMYAVLSLGSLTD